MDLRRESVTDLAGRVRRGELAARELVGHALERIEALDPTLHAFVAVDGERALEEAAAVDQAVAAGHDPGPLAGIPLAVKDLEDAAGFVTSRGSALFAGGPPAAEDSILVARLRAAGCVVVGKTNTPELGYKPDTDNPHFGLTRNPWNLDHTPGGSSGGSAVALAAGMVPLATGSDGGGSIRIPAACCGFTGIKPSLGRVPSGGSLPPDWGDFSTKGPMALRLADTVAALEVAVGPDPTDLRSLPKAEASWSAALEDPAPPLRVAWSPTLGYAEVDSEVLELCRRGVEVLGGLGADVVQVDQVFDADPVSDWMTFVNMGNLRNLAPFRDGPEWSKVDPVLALFVDAATSTTALELMGSLDACHRLNLRLVDLFREVRLLVTPTTAAAAPPRELAGAAMINGVEDINWVKFTYPFNMTRSPAATVCVGRTAAGIPVGLQLIGPQHGDLVVIRTAAALEAALGFDEVAPVG
ncbi:MAG: amidase [Actinomycetota bacterium]|nr:amidase [Actinomycetota bacterium]